MTLAAWPHWQKKAYQSQLPTSVYPESPSGDGVIGLYRSTPSATLLSALSWCKEIYDDSQRCINGLRLPLMLAPTTAALAESDFLSLLSQDRRRIFALWLHHGAILFRGFPVNTAEDFDKFMKTIFDKEATGLVHSHYSGASLRHQVVGNVLTANDSPADQRIPFHHETSQMPNHVTHVAFYCAVPPAKGGETPLLSSAELAQRLKTDMPDFSKQHAQSALMTHIILPVDDKSVNYGRGWYNALQTTSREEAERKTPSSCITRWTGPHFLCMQNIYECNTFIRDFRTSQEVFFNQLVGVSSVQKGIPHVFAKLASYPSTTLEELDALPSDQYTSPYDDEENLGKYFQELDIHAATGVLNDNFDPISRGDATRMCAIADEIKVEMAWEAKDIMIVDNRLVQHSRNAFTPPRTILAGLLYESLE